MYVFCPLQQIYGAITNAPTSNGSRNNAPGEASVLPPQSAPPGNHKSSDKDIMPPPTTPHHPSYVVSSSTSASKHKHSVLDESTLTSFRASSTNLYSKQQCNSTPNSALVLHGIGDALCDFHGTMCKGPLAQPCHHRRSSAECRIEVTALLQNTETLTAEQAIAITDLFEQSTAQADTYTALTHLSVYHI